MRQDQAINILEYISAAYPRFEITEKRVEIWVEQLADMPYERVLAKLKQHIKERAFPPSVAEISVYSSPKNEFLQQHERWLKKGAERIERDKQSRQPRNA